jgi:hypothetical protein
MARPKSSNSKNTAANLGFEAKHWLAADSSIESRTLATLRETLVAKLLSGESSVTEFQN